MSIFEYDQEAHMKLLREESREDGWNDGWKAGRDSGMEAGMDKGIQIGESKLARLTALLLEAGRLEDLKRAATDEDFREQLYKEFDLNES